MSTTAERHAYRIEDLSHLSGTTVRTIRAYTDRGLLPKPERRGRANVYGAAHLARLRQIAGLLDRGYTLASIKELLAAWDAGTGLGGVLGLVNEVDREHIRRHLGVLAPPEDPLPDPAAPAPPEPPPPTDIPVPLPAPTVAAVRDLVGPDHIPAFIAAATAREVASRHMDALTTQDPPRQRGGNR